MDFLSCIKEITMKSGCSEAGYIDIGDLNFYPEIRKICEENACRHYGTSWACPPAIGTLEICRERIQQYDTMLLFSKKYELEDSFDFEGMSAGLLDFKKVVDLLDSNLKALLCDYLLLSNEGCGKCTTCTYPHAPCRFPEFLHHSLEGYGFIVSELAAKSGICYNNGSNTVTYFGVLLFHSGTDMNARLTVSHDVD